jgi:hypothetical protein
MTPASAMHCRAGEPKSEHWWSLLLPTSVAATRKRPRSRLPPFEGLILHRIARHNTTDPRRPPELVVQAALADQPTRAFTHWQPANGAGLEIINWLDDHSRYLLAAIAAEGPTAEGATAEHDGRPGHYRLRYDRTDNHRKIASDAPTRMLHLGVGKQRTTPPSPPSPTRPATTDDSTHLSHMTRLITLWSLRTSTRTSCLARRRSLSGAIELVRGCALPTAPSRGQVQHRLAPARIEELIAAYRPGATAAALPVQFQIHRTAVAALPQRQQQAQRARRERRGI